VGNEDSGDARAEETATRHDPGRRARRPGGIPLRGWWIIGKRVVGQLGQDNVPMVAAGMAFFGFLSIFPALAGFVILFGLVADPYTVTDYLVPMRDLVPGQVFDLVATQLEKVAGETDKALGFGLLVSLGFAVWSSARGATALLTAMDIAYNEGPRQGWVRPKLTALMFTLAGLVFAVMAVGLLAAVPAAVALMQAREPLELVLLGTRWIVLAGLVLLALGLLYRYGPNRRRARISWITPGSVLASIVWIAASWGFARYVANVDSYNETFGALGAVVVLLMWLYISAYIVCLGAELNAELELYTGADTTVGGTQPKGRRGAFVADNTRPTQRRAD